MTHWTDLLVDAAPVRAIYGSSPPLLEGVDLHEMSLHRDGPRLLLRFDLHGFPDHPPAKWSASGLNRVQMRLLAVGVENLQISGFSSNMRMDLRIVKEGPLVRLCGQNEHAKFGLRTEFVMVDGISAYRQGD
ncbi:Imm50 family immunity protein [Variovorax sp. KK3]|uniref:Imm50 family immunity protein n=1 Tax=Variovorax sp. KK3 TaxID=1855728 RepID=UPI0015C3C6FF|nr:Imm50 family immunity protein [Variovorax sp. KK3]